MVERVTAPDGMHEKKAQGYALRLLKFRPRSTDEVRRKMLGKGYPALLIENVIAGLVRTGLLDDPAFTRAWLSCRLQRPMGLRRVTQELKDKGISAEIVQKEWDQLRTDYNEFEMVAAVVQKRIGRYSDLDPVKRNRRMTDYLLRRGFSADVIYKVFSAGRKGS
ncbi:MAG: regulatory protein RecX [Candidatus Omnitrophota bacterium]